MIELREQKVNNDIITDEFSNDSLSFEELQKLQKIKNNMLKGEYYTFNEVF